MDPIAKEARMQQLKDYVELIRAHQRDAEQKFRTAQGSTFNPSVRKGLQQQYSNHVALLEKQARDAAKEYDQHRQDLVRSSKPGALDKAQAAVESDKAAADLAKNKEAQLKASDDMSKAPIGGSGKSFRELLGYGPGVVNVSTDADGNRIARNPYSVTLVAPKAKDELKDQQALAEDKKRAEDRKELNKDVGAVFTSALTGKPLSAEAVFGSGRKIEFDAKGNAKPIPGVLGIPSKEQVSDFMNRFNATTPVEREAPERMKEAVTMPVEEYQRNLDALRAIDPRAAPAKGAVELDRDAQEFLRTAPGESALLDAQSSDLGRQDGLRLPSGAASRMPVLLPGASKLEKYSAVADRAGQLTNTPEADEMQAGELAVAARERREAQAQRAIAEKQQEEFLKKNQDSSIARELGFTVRPDKVRDVLDKSPVPAIRNRGQMVGVTNDLMTGDQLRNADPFSFEALRKAGDNPDEQNPELVTNDKHLMRLALAGMREYNLGILPALIGKPTVHYRVAKPYMDTLYKYKSLMVRPTDTTDAQVELQPPIVDLSSPD